MKKNLAIAIQRYRKMLISKNTPEQSEVIFKYRNQISKYFDRLDTASQKQVLAMAGDEY